MERARPFLRVQIAAIAIFAILKLTRSEWLVAAPPRMVEIFLWSFPNLFESVIGVMTLCALMIIGHERELALAKRLNSPAILMLSIAVTIIYAVSQELGLHRAIGGTNVTDINDVYFSLAGALGGGLIAWALFRNEATIV
ncbi:MAG: hypothetical protein AAGJ29_11550 [Pseudomonadota bacterium]